MESPEAFSGYVRNEIVKFWKIITERNIKPQPLSPCRRRQGRRRRGQGACRGRRAGRLTNSVVSYDHPHHAMLEEAITIDFVNSALGPGARVAVELTLQSAKALSAALERAIAAAEVVEGIRVRGT